jgi:hypothetical protein
VTVLIAIPLRIVSATPLDEVEAIQCGAPNAIGKSLEYGRRFINAGAPRVLRGLLEGVYSKNQNLVECSDQLVQCEIVDLKELGAIGAKLMVLTIHGRSGLTTKQLSALPLMRKESRQLLQKYSVGEFQKLDYSRAIVIQNEKTTVDQGLSRYVEFDKFDFQNRARAIAITVSSQNVAITEILGDSIPHAARLVKKWSYASKVAKVERDLWWESLFETPESPTLFKDLQEAFGLPSKSKQIFEYARTMRSEVSVALTVVNAVFLFALSIISLVH